MATTAAQKFLATIQKEGAFTFIPIPFSPKAAWSARPRYYVTGTVDGCAVGGCLGVLAGDYFLRLSAAWVKESGIGPGSEVTVRLAPDESRYTQKKSGK